MDNRDAGTQHKLRMPPELKERLFASAKEMNRSLNSEIVARLEKSFEEEVKTEQVIDYVFLDIVSKLMDGLQNEGVSWESAKNILKSLSKNKTPD